ncbi:peptidase M14, partial [Pseudidiomarina aestuarii]
MGGDTSYYFTPEARPYNPLITKTQREALWQIGENNAKWFDERGYQYFTREIFDAFYPGYGASWPLYHGSLAMTYEMASARGHKWRTKDGTILTYGDGVKRHFVASVATIESASQNRQQLLQNFWNYRSQAIRDGRGSDNRVRIIPGTDDAAAARKLAGLLVQHGVEVNQATESFKVCGNNYPAGSYIVDGAQPAQYMVRTLLDERIDMDQPFIDDQEERRANNLPDEIYDVTAWSLPLMFNVDIDACNSVPSVDKISVDGRLIESGSVTNADAKLGYIVAWGDMNAGRFLTAALRAGLHVKQSDLAFKHVNGKTYPAGSLILTHAENEADLAAAVLELARDSGAQVDGVDRSWVLEGPNFGSMNVNRVHAPNVAMAWDEPFSSLNAGHTRFVIEQQFNYPVTAIRTEQLARSNLSHYQVLILPALAGNFSYALGEAGLANLKDWVQKGGVLITLGTATRWAVDNDLLASAREAAITDKEPGHGDENRVDGLLLETAKDLAHYIQADEADPYWTAGILARGEVDQDHWLAAGVMPEVVSITVGNDIYRPLTIDNGRNIVSYAAADRVVASGYLWA